MSKSIGEWQDEIHEYARECGWWNEERNTGEILALIHSEVSECLEEYRTGNPLLTWWKAESGKPEGFPVELADIAIRLFDFAEHLGIDLEEFIRIKHEYNLTRPYRHGGKIA